MQASVSIIIPVLNEAAAIGAALERLAHARAKGVEVLVCDGGSSDASISRAQALCDCVIVAPRGRATQMNAGARQARGDILLFLHADTRLPEDWLAALRRSVSVTGKDWGRFDVKIESTSRLLQVVGAMMNLRSRWTGIATGDQAMFVRREVFNATGEFPDIPLMEDIALSKRLKRISHPVCLCEKVITSGRRWEKNGVLRTILMMWRLRIQYWLGADPARLAQQYGYRPRETKS